MPHVDADACVLVVIDAQPGFYGPEREDVDRGSAADALARAAWVTGVASALGIPVVVTEEDAARNGPTASSILHSVPEGTPVLDKAVFGADGNPDIDAAVRSYRRDCIVLVGMESDVCVAQSALGWHGSGLRVLVVRDAVYSPGAAHGHGLSRLAEAGVELLSAKELYYEWLRTLAAVRSFDAAHPELAQPPGFSL